MSEIRISVQLKAALARFAPIEGQDAFTLSVPEMTTAESVLQRLNVPLHWVGLILVNGQRVGESTPLRNGDALTVYPIKIAGG